MDGSRGSARKWLPETVLFEQPGRRAGVFMVEKWNGRPRRRDSSRGGPTPGALEQRRRVEGVYFEATVKIRPTIRRRRNVGVQVEERRDADAQYERARLSDEWDVKHGKLRG